MVRVAIVDNAPACQTILTGLCRRYEAEQGRALDVTVFDDGDAFVASYTPDWDVIIIDVDLGGIDGLGVMRRIREVDDAVEAILVSLTDEYAVGGYEINAMSYILKPPSYEVFAHDMTRCLDGRRACERRTIQVISGGRTRRMRLDEIIYVDSVKHRTILHTMLGNMQIVCSIIRFEERLIELDHAVTLGIADVIPEDGRALFLLPGADEEIFEAVAEENIVPKDQAGVASLDEISGKEERLSDTFRLRLCDVFKGASPLAAVPEKFAELPAVVWRGDDGNLTDARQKENRQRIIDHRLIVDRQQLLADAEREGVKPRTGTARQQDTFP